MCDASSCCAERRRGFVALCCLGMLLLGLGVRSASAQPGMGSLGLSGGAVALLESASFEPSIFEATADTWVFDQLVPAHSLLVAPDPNDPTRAVIVSFVEIDGEGWSYIDLAAGVPGLSISGRDIVFAQVTLPIDAAKSGADELVLDGTLTRPEQVGSARRSFGALKSGH